MAAVSGTLDNPFLRQYPLAMNMVRRTVEIDPATDARLQEMAKERGRDVAAVLAEAVALLDSVIEIDNPDIQEDRRRLSKFARTREAIPLHEIKAWVDSWGSGNELPRPRARRVE